VLHDTDCFSAILNNSFGSAAKVRFSLKFLCHEKQQNFIFEINSSVINIKISLLNSLTLSVCPSVCPSVPNFFAIFQPTIFEFRILREDCQSTRTASEGPRLEDQKPRSSGIELRLGPSQIKAFSLYFINFWITINVFQLIEYKYFRKIFTWKHWKQLVVAQI
jgi:hypothetical protein